MIDNQPRRIPWDKVMEWCDRHDYSEDDAEFMDACFQAMDDVLIDRWHETRKGA